MRTIKLILSIITISFLGMMVSCKKSSTSSNFNADKTVFKNTLDSLRLLYNNTVDGTRPGQYVAGARANLDSVLQLATQVYSGTTYTQEQVDNAWRNLLTAGQIFSTNLLQEVSVANLVAFWKFNGNADDSSGHGHNGMLKAGLTTFPLPTADKFGRPNMAYSFSNAANIEVPYDAGLNPQSLTISVWVKIATSTCDNYILSLNHWDGFKFQLQCNNFPFFTFHDNSGGYHDVDANPGVVPFNAWTHVVMSYTTGTIKFYINGDLKKTAVVVGVPITVNPAVNLTIANDLPGGTSSFFVGSMDNLRFYNTTLSDAEVRSIYTQENTL